MRHTTLLTITLAGLFLGCAETRQAEDYPEAVTADPAHYSVEYENDAVRLLRIQYGPGEESVMHYHPATCSIALGARFARSQASRPQPPNHERRDQPNRPDPHRPPSARKRADTPSTYAAPT